MPTSSALLGLDQPQVLPQHVARVTADGRPTRYLLDWEQYTYQFQSSVLQSIDTRIATVESDYIAGDATIAASVVTEQIARADADGALASDITTLTADMNTADGVLAASVTTEALARADGDGALALDVTRVEAKADGASAFGEVYLVAEVAPSGYTASYGWELTVGGQSIGMRAMLTSGGIGEIAFTASQFKLTDPSYNGGLPGNVFSYGSGVFTFNVPVEVRNGDLGANSVSNTVANSGGVGTGAALTTASLTVRAGARVLVRVALTDVSASRYTASFLGSYFSRTFQVDADGGATVIGNLVCVDSIIDFQYFGGSVYAFYKGVTPATAEFVVTGLSAGTHTFTITNSSAYTLGMAISATELSK